MDAVVDRKIVIVSKKTYPEVKYLCNRYDHWAGSVDELNTTMDGLRIFNDIEQAKNVIKYWNENNEEKVKIGFIETKVDFYKD